MNTSFYARLLAQLEKFEKCAGGNPSVEDFRIWLNKEHYASQSPSFISEKVQVKNLDNELAKQVILLSRFTKQMIRRGLSEFPDLHNEEFTYLYRLVDEKGLTKMQLIERNGHEKQTGMAIITRLVSNGLIIEVRDELDKRAKRLIITEKGLQLFYESAKPVNEISKILGGNLADEDKEKLLETLKKLNDFHFMVYRNYRDATIHEIGSLI